MLKVNYMHATDTLLNQAKMHMTAAGALIAQTTMAAGKKDIKTNCAANVFEEAIIWQTKTTLLI